MSRCAVPENDDDRHEYGPSQPRWKKQLSAVLPAPRHLIRAFGCAGGAAARSHSSGATPAEKERHVADAAAFDARELGGRYRALRERVPCRSRYLPNQ